VAIVTVPMVLRINSRGDRETSVVPHLINTENLVRAGTKTETTCYMRFNNGDEIEVELDQNELSTRIGGM
jgi:hypothetical protein